MTFNAIFYLLFSTSLAGHLVVSLLMTPLRALGWRLLVFAGWIPIQLLALFTIAFVWTGIDPLPGNNGGRWMALLALAFAGLVGSGWALEHYRAARKASW